ncbi:hypothetical protein SETIT_2G235000v2 [Setaria italica]|uniref:DUF547 domain-containing protein n=1 Tax=Setaria italica TaxID=4555 RepID=K3ZRS3_SETIT|nr:uncharacterized protein LOC101777101 [Setaria italica]RCV12027.1 hypothetical protein SETIT_2G235000v2 [Setaria italica]
MEKDPRKAATPVKGSARAGTGGAMNRIQARRERKLALQQDVDKLKKKLRHEENVHRALERAFTRPLGALPRLPPYLPSQTLALLAEVAVLEEEVVRLEEQVVNFRQGIYKEAIIFSTAKNTHPSGGEVPVPVQLVPSNPVPNSVVSPTAARPGSDHPPTRPSPHNGVVNGKQAPRKPVPGSGSQDDRSGAGKENQSCSNTSSASRNSRQTPLQQKTPSKSRATPAVAPDRRRATPAQTTSAATPDRKRPADASASNRNKATSQDDSSVPNKLSEELLQCLLTIFSRMGSAGGGHGDEDQQAPSPSVSGSSESSGSGSEDAYPQDPYGILELGARDIGPYKRFHVVDAASFDRNAVAGDGDAFHARRLKALLRRLSSVDLAGLSHQQKLAFWINVYNSCMMNAFLEQGIPTTPQMLVAMMPKATINVGGRAHSAMSIEHFILRLPYSVKQVNPEGAKAGDDVTARGAFGLEWPEPLVTFALSCGSWSSPAVRVYTAARVEEELEAAKREYLQAAVGVTSPGKLAVPKLLHWYLLDFAKDVDSFMDWVCLQLPAELRQEAMRSVEDGRRGGAEPRRIQVLPYEFRFRYLLASS